MAKRKAPAGKTVKTALAARGLRLKHGYATVKRKRKYKGK